MADFLSPRPQHLGIFVSDPVSGVPTERLPIHAEVVVSRIVPLPPPDDHFRELIFGVLSQLDRDISGATRSSLADLLAQAIAEIIDLAGRLALQRDRARARELLRDVLEEVLARSGRADFALLPQAELRSLLDDTLRRAAERMQLPLRDVQGRFSATAVVARLPISVSPLPEALANMGPQSLQNPGLTDWLLSPASFAASPKTLIGQDGCEELAPASVLLQEFVFRPVVRRADPPRNLAVPDPYKAACVDEYKVSWFMPS